MNMTRPPGVPSDEGDDARRRGLARRGGLRQGGRPTQRDQGGSDQHLRLPPVITTSIAQGPYQALVVLAQAADDVRGRGVYLAVPTTAALGRVFRVTFRDNARKLPAELVRDPQELRPARIGGQFQPRAALAEGLGVFSFLVALLLLFVV